MSDLASYSRRRRRRDRTKTHSDAVLTSIPVRHKRPFDEINRSSFHGRKRRALSATTTRGNENVDCSLMIIDEDDEGCRFVSLDFSHLKRIFLSFHFHFHFEEIKSMTTNVFMHEKKAFLTRFENSLPNEILFEIFKYLSQSELFYAFLNLNQRFNRILQPFTHHIDCSKLSIEQFEHLRNHLYNAKSLIINNQVTDTNFQRLSRSFSCF